MFKDQLTPQKECAPQRIEHNLPPEKCLDLSELRQWVRAHEVPFFNALTHYSDLIHNGREQMYWKKVLETEPFSTRFEQTKELGFAVNSGLCALSSAAFLHGIHHRFGPQMIVRAAVSPVRVANLYHLTDSPESLKKIPDIVIPHIRLHFPSKDGGSYFLDASYGQHNKALNRVVIDRQTKEADYYGANFEAKDCTLDILVMLDRFSHFATEYKELYSLETLEEFDQAYREIFISLGAPPYQKIAAYNLGRVRDEAA